MRDPSDLDAWLCDKDGVLMHGDVPIPGAAEYPSLSTLRRDCGRRGDSPTDQPRRRDGISPSPPFPPLSPPQGRRPYEPSGATRRL